MLSVHEASSRLVAHHGQTNPGIERVARALCRAYLLGGDDGLDEAEMQVQVDAWWTQWIDEARGAVGYVL